MISPVRTSPRKLLILARQVDRNWKSRRPCESLVPRSLALRPFSHRFFSSFLSTMRNAERLNARNRAAQCCDTSARSNAVARAPESESSRTIIQSRYQGSDNIIAFTTKRYRLAPFVVQGPGAGADVTAMAFSPISSSCSITAAQDPELFFHAFESSTRSPAL